MSDDNGSPSPSRGYEKIAPKPEGIYAITPDGWPLSGLLDCVEAALEAGVKWVQYRDKQRSAEDRFLYGCGLVRLVKFYEGHLIVNDSLPICKELTKAGYAPSGIHLGKEDGDIREARIALGPKGVIGSSCYDEFERAAISIKHGASYVAFGTLFPSITKPKGVKAPLSLITKTATAFRVPVVGIGGIDAVNVIRVAEAGASAAAVITSLFGVYPDPEKTYRSAMQLVENFAHGVRVREETAKA